MSADNAPDLAQVMAAAQHMQQEVQRIQGDLAQRTVEGSAGGSMVVVRANGRQQVLSISIEESLLDRQEIDILQDLIVAAVNQALGKAGELAQSEMAQVAGGLPIKIPGLV